MSDEAHLLVRPPPTSLTEGIVSHIADQRDSITYERALSQWNAYIDVFKAHGWRVRHVQQDNSLPDSVFAEDAIISINDLTGQKTNALLILSSPGNEAREKEIEGVKAAIVEEFPSHELAQIVKPGTLDGGDVLKIPVDRTVYIGSSARTNAEGQRQFRALVEPLGWKVVSVPVVKALHLKSMLTALPDGSIVGYEPLLEDSTIFPRFIAMPEPEGVAVVHLSPQNSKSSPLIMSSAAPRSAARLRELGYDVTTVDIGEFESEPCNRNYCPRTNG